MEERIDLLRSNILQNFEWNDMDDVMSEITHFSLLQMFKNDYTRNAINYWTFSHNELLKKSTIHTTSFMLVGSTRVWTGGTRVESDLQLDALPNWAMFPNM